MSEQLSADLPGILYVDDEIKALKIFEKAYSKTYRIFTADGAAGGMEILGREADQISIVVSDQRMPGVTGVEFLSEVRSFFPDKIRILTTAYSDLDSAIESVNRGRIYQYVVKPWDIQEFEMVLRRAFDYYTILSERNKLMSLKMSTFQRIILADRTKTLSALARVMETSEGDLLRTSLSSMIRAFPPALDKHPADAGGAFVKGGIRELLFQEREAVSAFTDFWDDAERDARVALEGFVDAFRTGDSEYSCEVEISGRTFDLKFHGPGENADGLFRCLFGVLVEPVPSDISLRFFRTVGLSVAGSGTLTVRLKFGGKDRETLVFDPVRDSERDGFEKALRDLYDRMDAKSLGS